MYQYREKHQKIKKSKSRNGKARPHEVILMGRIQGDLKERTMAFALNVLGLVDRLPNNVKGWEIGRQLLRAGTGIGANVREADHALTDSDFAHKCSIARKEASESQYWIEICISAKLLPLETARIASQEAEELSRILAAVVRKTQEHVRGQ